MKLFIASALFFGLSFLGTGDALSKPTPPIEPLLFPAHFSELRRDMSESEVRSKLGNPSSLTVPVEHSMTAVDDTGFCLTYRRVARSDTAGNDRHRDVDTWNVAFSNGKLKAWGKGSDVSNQCSQHFEMKHQMQK